MIRGGEVVCSVAAGTSGPWEGLGFRFHVQLTCPFDFPEWGVVFP